jgi:hypothetical protein
MILEDMNNDNSASACSSSTTTAGTGTGGGIGSGSGTSKKGTCSCPQCDFQVEYDNSPSDGSADDDSSQKIPRRNARAAITAHYQSTHLSITPKDDPEVENGREFYRCTQCPIKFLLQTELQYKNTEKRRRCFALMALSRHYINCHEQEGKVVEKRAVRVRKEEVQPEEIMAASSSTSTQKLVLKCPQCDFTCSKTQGNHCCDNDAKFTELESHYVAHHISFPHALMRCSKDRLSKRKTECYVKTNTYKCLKCPFSSEVLFEDEEERGPGLGVPTMSEVESLRDLGEHYLMNHEDLTTTGLGGTEDEGDDEGFRCPKISSVMSVGAVKSDK